MKEPVISFDDGIIEFYNLSEEKKFITIGTYWSRKGSHVTITRVTVPHLYADSMIGTSCMAAFSDWT